MKNNLSFITSPRGAEKLLIVWIFIALLGHTAWGVYPVMLRYLQTVSRLPPFSMAGVGNAIVLVILLFTVLPKVQPVVFKKPILWLFAAAVVGRSVTNLLAPRYTLATYVQLVNLLAPFIVVFLSVTFFKDRVPRHSILAVSLTLIGAMLMLSSDAGINGLTFNLTANDWTGISLSLVSATFWGFYMVLTRRSLQANLPGESILLTQMVVLVIVYFLTSFSVGEKWERWTELGPMDWSVFIAFTFIALYGANSLNILALKHLSAPLVSSMMAWRLVSTLGGGYLLLGEKLTSPWQVVGAVIVLVTISWYLWQQQPAPPVEVQ